MFPTANCIYNDLFNLHYIYDKINILGLPNSNTVSIPVNELTVKSSCVMSLCILVPV